MVNFDKIIKNLAKVKIGITHLAFKSNTTLCKYINTPPLFTPQKNTHQSTDGGCVKSTGTHHASHYLSRSRRKQLGGLQMKRGRKLMIRTNSYVSLYESTIQPWEGLFNVSESWDPLWGHFWWTERRRWLHCWGMVVTLTDEQTWWGWRIETDFKEQGAEMEGGHVE